jgi:hypothetical protein
MRCFLSFLLHMYSLGLSSHRALLLPLAGRLAVGKGLFRGLHLHGFALEHHTFPFHVVFKSHQKFRRSFSHTRRSSAVCASSSDLHVPCESLLYHPALATVQCFCFLMLSITPPCLQILYPFHGLAANHPTCPQPSQLGPDCTYSASSVWRFPVCVV